MMRCENSCLNNSEPEQTSSSSQIDALGQILGRPIVGVIGLALGIPVSLTICAVVLATAQPLLIQDDPDRSAGGGISRGSSRS